MNTYRILSLWLLGLLSLLPAQAQPKRPSDMEYPSVHDPVVCYCEGKYYLFCTGFGVSVLSSPDLKRWTPERPVFAKVPEWALQSVPGYRGHTWAPDILFHNGRYYLYYSCSSFGKNSSAIGVAVNKTLNPSSPDYAWEDQGCLVRSIPGRDNWNAIDPNVLIDDKGQGWLTFGSFWGGIKMVRLDSTLCALAQPEEWYGLSCRPKYAQPQNLPEDNAVKPDRRGALFEPGNGAVEAPFIYKKGDYYYLFVSFDLCCRGEKSTYKVVVGRSKDIKGPYLDHEGRAMMEGGGSIVVEGNERYPGVGHSATVSIQGNDYLFFHAYDRDFNYGSKLLIRRLYWDNEGWPHAVLEDEKTQVIGL